MARARREDHPGRRWHLYNRGIAKRAVFETARDAEYFLALIGAAVAAGLIEVHAFSRMTTHFHLLACSVAGDVSAAMQRIVNPFVRWFNRTRKRDGPLRSRGVCWGADRGPPVGRTWRATCALRCCMRQRVSRRPRSPIVRARRARRSARPSSVMQSAWPTTGGTRSSSAASCVARFAGVSRCRRTRSHCPPGWPPAHAIRSSSAREPAGVTACRHLLWHWRERLTRCFVPGSVLTPARTMAAWQSTAIP